MTGLPAVVVVVLLLAVGFTAYSVALVLATLSWSHILPWPALALLVGGWLATTVVCVWMVLREARREVRPAEASV